MSILTVANEALKINHALESKTTKYNHINPKFYTGFTRTILNWLRSTYEYGKRPLFDGVIKKK